MAEIAQYVYLQNLKTGTMRQGSKVAILARVFTVVGMLIFANHFVCTLAYSLPADRVPEGMRQWSNNYMVPFFHQGWRLFAPDVPQSYYGLNYRFKSADGWSSFEPCNDLHRLTSHIRVRSVSQKLLMYMGRGMQKGLYLDDEGNHQYDVVVHQSAYHRLLYYAAQRHAAIYGSRPDEIQLQMEVVFSSDFNSGERAEPLLYTFPVYNLIEQSHEL